jgi:hypothetical protein
VREAGRHLDVPVAEAYPDVQHLGDEVAVGESAPTDRAAAARVDAYPDVVDVRLQRDCPLDRPREPRRRPGRDRYPEVLVEDPPELDAGFEQERFPSGERGAVERTRSRGGLTPPPLFASR